VARLLRTRGWDVQVFFYGKVTGLPADACRNCDRWHQMGGETEHLGFPQVSSKDAERFKMAAYKDPVADLVIDAAFGIGLTRPLEGLRPIIALNNHFCGPAAVARAGYHVSIDLPSGLAESGPLSDTLASVFYADLTVTFHRQKKAHGQGRAFCGQIDVRDIGL
jgi:NAD(P)H-hydrate repair Nnr-like enzyme with NAD(P)H-hydrate epimerase domain